MSEPHVLESEVFKFKLGEVIYELDLVEAEMVMEAEPISMDLLDAENCPSPNRYVPLFQKWLQGSKGIEVSFSQAFKLMESLRYAYLDFKKKYNEELKLEFASAQIHFDSMSGKYTSSQLVSPEFEQQES